MNSPTSKARRESTWLIVSDLTLEMSIGIYEEEKLEKQPVQIDIDAEISGFSGVSRRPDHIDHTVSYEAIVRHTKRIAALRHYNLVETFAETLSEYFLKNFPIKNIRIRVMKPEIIDNAKVGVEIFRVRSR